MQVFVCVAIIVGWVVSWVAKAVVVMMIGQHTQHILHAYIHILLPSSIEKPSTISSLAKTMSGFKIGLEPLWIFA